MSEGADWEPIPGEDVAESQVPSSQVPVSSDAKMDHSTSIEAHRAREADTPWERFFSVIGWPIEGPRRGPVLLGLLISLPIIAAQMKLSGRHWYPGGDMAQAELHVRGFWANPPLVGAAGRIASDAGLQGSHPGPSLWLALWPVYALFGQTSRGLIISVGVVHIVSVIALLWLARRRGGTSLMVLVAIAAAFLIRASGTDFATEPWNPWLAVIPFGAFIFLCWSLIEGELWTWPVAVVVGSHCIHCHAGYALVVIAILGTATLLVIVQAWKPGAWRFLGPASEPRRTAVACGAGILAGLAIWAPALVDEFRREPGNLSILIQHFGSPTEPPIARKDALRIIANQLNLAGPWVQGRQVLSVNALGLIGIVALWAGAVFFAARAQHRSALRGHALLAAGVFAGCLSTSRLFGGYFEYTVRWWWVLTALIAAMSIWTLWSSDRSQSFRDAAAHTLTSLVVIALVGVPLISLSQFLDRAELPGPAETELVGKLSRELIPAVEQLDDPTLSRKDPPKYLMRWFDPHYLGSSAFGLVLELERQGISVGVDPEFSAAALPHRVFDEAEVDGVLYLVIGDRIAEVSEQTSAIKLADFDARSALEASRSREVRQELTERFAEIGRAELADQLDKQYGLTSLIFSPTPLPDDITALVVEYLNLGQPAAVFLVPSGTPLDAVPELARATG